MKRISLFLDERTVRFLSRMAAHRQVSVASLIKEVVANYLAGPVNAGRLPSVAGRFSSGRHDAAERKEELLWNVPRLTPDEASAFRHDVEAARSELPAVRSAWE
jgi:hypothetical protein